MFIYCMYHVLSDHLLVAFIFTSRPKSLKGDNFDSLCQVVMFVLAGHLCMNSLHMRHLFVTTNIASYDN